MKNNMTAEAAASLAEIPVFAEYEDESTSNPVPDVPSVRWERRPALGIYSARELDGARDALPAADVDWTKVVELRRLASAAITEETEDHVRNAGAPLAGDDRLLMGRAIIKRVVGDHVRTLHREGADLWSTAQEQAYVHAVEDAVFGYGRLQPLLEMPEVENIEIHGFDSVVVQYGDGRRQRMPAIAANDEELLEAIRFLGQNTEPSRPFDDAHPTMTLALGERFRLHAIGFGLSYRPSVVIRQHTLTDVSLADLAASGLMPQEVAQFLDAAILARKSMVISGDQGAGKTTLLRALINSIPPNERFGTLETDYALMTHLQRGRENILALQARVAQGGVLTIEEAYRQIAHNIHLFIYVKLVDETWKGGSRRRFISEVRQVTRAIESGRPVTHLTYSSSDGPGQAAGFYPDADFEAELLPFRRELR